MNKEDASISSCITNNVFFRLYTLAWKFTLPLLRRNYRLAEGFKQRTLQDNIPSSADIWIQSASVGESFLACNLLKHLEPPRPLRILLTSNTRQGVEILQRFADDYSIHPGALSLTVSYFPFDKPDIMKKAVKAVRPEIMVFLETEIWPGLLTALKTNGSNILIINGRITEKSLKRYLVWPSLWKKLSPNHILAISKSDAIRFEKLFGMETVGVMPNIKFDRLLIPEAKAAADNPIKKLLHPDAPFVVLASVRQGEEDEVEKIILHIRSRYPETVFGLVPRHLHRVEYWKNALHRMAIPWKLRTKTEQIVSKGTVILWDTFGELPRAYALAAAVFVGGSLAPLGGQNFLEVLTSGVIPVIGPFWNNFSWVGKEITEQKLVNVAADWKEAAEILLADIQTPLSRETVRRKARQYIENRRGGTAQACRLINHYLNP